MKELMKDLGEVNRRAFVEEIKSEEAGVGW